MLDEFRFHLTLSGPLNPERCERLRETLQEAVQAFAGEPLGPLEPMAVRDIALFGDPGDGGRFRLLKRYPLG